MTDDSLSQSIPVLSLESFPGYDCSPIGYLIGCCCLSKSAVGDLLANAKNWSIGGELHSYTDMIEIAVEAAIDRVRAKALLMEADAVVGLRLTTTKVSDGTAEIVAYGTAVKVEKRTSDFAKS